MLKQMGKKMLPILRSQILFIMAMSTNTLFRLGKICLVSANMLLCNEKQSDS